MDCSEGSKNKSDVGGGGGGEVQDDHRHGHRGGGGPCGACRFLRRKCVRGCVFAPYFEAERLGTAHFAAVHKVFGASNASKLLQRVPAPNRLDAVLTLCYEALARARDPVYGCVAHIFALQHQVVSLQAELAYVQARLSTLQRLPPVVPPLPQPQSTSSSSPSHLLPYSSSTIDLHFDPLLHQPHPTSLELSTFLNHCDQQPEQQLLLHEGDLQSLAREFVSRYFPEVRFRSSNSH